METNEENQEIGELLTGIIANGFSLNIFQRWKAATGQNQGENENPVENTEPVPTPGPKTYIAIQSNELRDSPELNSRLLKAGNLVEAVRKAAKVARYIVDTSEPIR